MRYGIALVAFAVPAAAHMISMSSGELRIEGTRAEYQLFMPAYEIGNLKDPGDALLGHIRFLSAGQPARLTSKDCNNNSATGQYVCTAQYEFAAPVDALEVQCSFYAVTVPNHVHLLHAEKDGRRDQAMFDQSFNSGTLRFRPPSAFETISRQFLAGAARALGGWVQILFLASLVLAARNRRELLWIAAAFALGECGAAVFAPLQWIPSPKFVEAAAALSIAYLAFEVLLLPEGRFRWVIAAVLGAFYGLYFSLLLANTGYRAWAVLSGAVVVQWIVVVLFGLFAWRLGRMVRWAKAVPVSAGLLLVFGMGWFFWRLRG